MQDLVEKQFFIARNDQGMLILVKEHFDLSGMMGELVKETGMLNTAMRSRALFLRINIRRCRRIKQALRSLPTTPGSRLPMGP